jgi:hypothetical protein
LGVYDYRRDKKVVSVFGDFVAPLRTPGLQVAGQDGVCRLL